MKTITLLIVIKLINVFLCLGYSSIIQLQSNLNDSNTDGSFTVANSNLFLSPKEFLPTAQESKYLWIS